MSPISRRKRNILMATLFVAGVFVVTIWTIWEGRSKQTYLPGEQVDGLTIKGNRQIPEDYPGILFEDVTRQAGILFHHFPFERTSQLPEDMGSGAVWFDYNNDGREDLFIVNFAAPLNGNSPLSQDRVGRCSLYGNNGGGTFTDVSEKAGVSLAVRGMGAAAADYDNDGWTDLIVTAYGTNHLLRNNGDGTFSDISRKSGLGDREGFWTGSSWSDYDRDGDLDLYITGYVKYVDFSLPAKDLAVEEPPSINPSSFRPERNLFYLNNGDGTFIEIAGAAGVENASGRSLSAAWSDFNNDLWPDLYVANDVSDNAFYLNKGDGTFENLSYSARVADYRGAMGLATGDWDNDLDMDLFITHWIAQENALYTNLFNHSSHDDGENRIQFTDDSDKYGLGQPALDYIGWATSFMDFDNDTRLDVWVVNGSTFQFPEEPVRLKPMKDQIFWNGGKDRGFFEVTAESGLYFSQQYPGRGGAVADYDRDGDIDLFVVNNNGPGILLNNQNQVSNNWLQVQLEGRQSNRSAIGARLRLVSDSLEQIRQVGSQSSYLSQNSLIQHFGMGSHTIADTLEIIWPSGHKDIYLNISPGQLLKVTEGQPQISIRPGG